MKKQKSKSVRMGLALVMVVASLWVVGAVNAQNGPVGAVHTVTVGNNKIVIHDQDTNSNVAYVDEVDAAQPGWLVVYKDANGSLGEMVGYTSVQQGKNTGLNMAVSSSKIGDDPTLWAVLHMDSGAMGTFEFGGADTPVTVNGQMVEVAFGSAAASGQPSSSTPGSAAPSTSGQPTTLPTTGGGNNQMLGWLLLVGLGILIVVIGLELRRVRV